MRSTTFCHKIWFSLPVAMQLILVPVVLQGFLFPHAIGAAESSGFHQKPESLSPKHGLKNGDRQHDEPGNSRLVFDRSFVSSNPAWPPAISSFRQYDHRDQAWIEEELPKLKSFFTTKSIDQEMFDPIPTIEQCVYLRRINKRQLIGAYTLAGFVLIQQTITVVNRFLKSLRHLGRP